jgi:hypothetical protein
MSHYGIQVFELSVDQICSLLQNVDSTTGVDIAQLGAVPLTQYQVMSGGRFFPSVTREDISQVMQGVDVLVVTTLNGPWSVDFLAKEFFQCLVEEKLLDQCKAVVVRISAWKTDNTWLHRSSIKPLTADAILSESGLNAAKTIQDKLYVLADKEVDQTTRRSRKKKKKQPKLDADMTVAISQLRARLLGEEVKMAVVAPVKETVSAGKALLNMGQRLSTWVTSLVKS